LSDLKGKGGIVILTKSYVQNNESTKTTKTDSAPDAAALEKINRFTRRNFSTDELYVFPVILCDNEIDRDGERFSIPALTKLAELFLGKTGIFNHSGKAQDQTARVFDCRVESDPTRKTSAGEPYTRLKAAAYLPRTEKNANLIAELESGIKKEVSVGCAVGSAVCSICGADLKSGSCGHERGRSYDGRVCCAVLSDPTDAYEWSFVAVPSQREAGVTKNYSGKEGTHTDDILKALRRGEEVTLTRGQAAQLAEKLTALEREAACGRAYRGELTKQFLRNAALSKPEIPSDTLRRAADAMELEDLKCFAAAFRRGADRLVPLSPQLAGTKRQAADNGNSDFKI
jgi:hypothetical protein